MADVTASKQVSAMRAVAHPVRLQILSLLTGAELSAAEIARELGITHANASYHLRFLADAGTVVVAGEEKIRGGTAKRYRHPWDAESLDGPKAEALGDQRAYVKAMAQELERRYQHRRRGTGTRHFLADAELWVAPEVWQRAAALVEEAARLIHAEAKPARTAGTLHVNMTAAIFEMDGSRGNRR